MKRTSPDPADHSEHIDQTNVDELQEELKVLCNHCGRNAKNGIRCLGMCVADNDY